MPTTTPAQFPDRAAWLAHRQNGIGASDAPTVLGLTRKSPFQLWAEKTAQAEPDDLSRFSYVRIGQLIEPAVLQLYRELAEVDAVLAQPFTVHQHAERPYLFCTPDAWQIDPDGERIPVQIKTTGARFARNWRDAPPAAAQAQLQAELAVLGAPRGVLVALIGGQYLRWFTVERHDRFIDAMLDLLDGFWRHVWTRTPPEPDGSDATRQTIGRMYPESAGVEEIAALPEAADDWTDRIEAIDAQVDALTAERGALTNRIRLTIGAATLAETPRGRLWRYATQGRSAGRTLTLARKGKPRR